MSPVDLIVAAVAFLVAAAVGTVVACAAWLLRTGARRYRHTLTPPVHAPSVGR